MEPAILAASLILLAQAAAFRLFTRREHRRRQVERLKRVIRRMPAILPAGN